MATMPRLASLARRHLPFVGGGLALAFVGFWSTPSRADVLGSCDALNDLITCAATDVGKPCQGGGRCVAIPCANGQLGAGTTMFYKCDTCPTIVAVPAGTCSYTNLGSTCATDGGTDGGSGTCATISPHCQTDLGTGKLECQIPSTENPTGPPAGETGGSGGASATGSAGATGTAGHSGAGTAGSGGGSGTAGSGAAGSAAGKSSTSSGCDIAPKPPKPTQIGLGLVAIGIVIFLVDRARRRSR
jgi:hypothetical protein